MNSLNLIDKYNIPGPRYTSYPTVPYWDESSFSVEQWKKLLKKSFQESNKTEGISLYIHLPYCESLCTFCACNKRITKQHSVEEPYINALLQEWNLYVNLLNEKPIIKEIHLGGGTPTFFSPKNLEVLLTGILSKAQVHEKREFSFEGHPNNTTQEHLQTLYDCGFRRVSFGVQDYDPKVQKAIHRIQSFENVKNVTSIARKIGYESIGHDLIFGLPFQKLESVINTIELTKNLQPDRIAFYSYAHVPWIKGVGQRGFDEKDLPNGEEKRILYEKGKELLEQLEYKEIAMDHFSLVSDKLYQSMQNKTIHRNFMGYTSSSTQVMISLGVSSISDSWYAFAQNEKNVDDYINCINKGELAVCKGHVLTSEDLIIRRKILDIMCLMETTFSISNTPHYEDIRDRLYELEKDDLINITEEKIIVEENGRSYLRNVCMAFDLRMIRKMPTTRIFSMVV